MLVLHSWLAIKFNFILMDLRFRKMPYSDAEIKVTWTSLFLTMPCILVVSVLLDLSMNCYMHHTRLDKKVFHLILLLGSICNIWLELKLLWYYNRDGGFEHHSWATSSIQIIFEISEIILNDVVISPIICAQGKL